MAAEGVKCPTNTQAKGPLEQTESLESGPDRTNHRQTLRLGFLGLGRDRWIALPISTHRRGKLALASESLRYMDRGAVDCTTGRLSVGSGAIPCIPLSLPCTSHADLVATLFHALH